MILDMKSIHCKYHSLVSKTNYELIVNYKFINLLHIF